MEYNIKYKRGDSLNIYLTFTQDGVAIDITNYTLFFTMKTNADDPDSSAVCQKTVAGSTCPNPTGGEGLISIPASETASFLGDYYYDIQYKDNAIPTPNVVTPYEGVITWERDITRRIS